MTTEEKIRIIESTNSFAEVPHDILPPSHKESYYFVSYSHRDYKMVLADILRLEELGVNIWYDNEMHIGENWQEIAQLYISKFQCAGVIFYLTDNSICSPACNQEVEYVLTHNKNFISINKPLYGRHVESGYSMLCELCKEGMPCSDELLKNFKTAFGNEILYLSAEDSIERKAQQILSIPREDLLNVELGYAKHSTGKVATVTACKDNTIINVDLSKIYSFENVESYEEKEYHIGRIDDCVFTNAIKLSRVKVSDKLLEIGESAFRNCISLTDVDLSGTKGITIGKNAFRGCRSLADIDLTRAGSIEESAFQDCSSLSSVKASGYFGPCAFLGTDITDFEFLGGCSYTGHMVFYNCKKLKSFKTDVVWSKLGDNIFSGCTSLCQVSELIAPKVVNGGGEQPAKLGSSAFGYCTSLERITLKGDWDLSLSAYAFSGCTALEEIDYQPFSTENAKLAYGFAKGCKKLKRMGASERFAHIGEGAFEECESLSEFDFTAVTELDDRAFASSGIEKAYLPKVRKIGKSAFSLCKNMKHLQIGEGCESIGEYAFYNCHSLKTVKILSENIKLPKGGEVFEKCTSIEIFYLRSAEVLRVLETDETLLNIAVLYIGDNLDVTELSDLDFTEAESDEAGYRKFVHLEREVTVDPEEEIDLWDGELNEPDKYHEKYEGAARARFNFGKDVEIKHLRLRRPRKYFIEYAETNEFGYVDYLTVSTHEGHSFRLDGTLIEEITPIERPAGLYFRIPEGCDLMGKSCCIAANGEFHYCVISAVNLAMLYGVPMPFVNRETVSFENAVESIVYLEDDKTLAVSGIDIESITVFNDDFEVELSITRPKI